VITPTLSLLLNCNVATNADSYTLSSYFGNNELAYVAKVKAPSTKITIDHSLKLNGCDYIAVGRNLRASGLEGLSKHEIVTPVLNTRKAYMLLS
jgi:hypothetical protein